MGLQLLGRKVSLWEVSAKRTMSERGNLGGHQLDEC